jgi:hypothetical protein
VSLAKPGIVPGQTAQKYRAVIRPFAGRLHCGSEGRAPADGQPTELCYALDYEGGTWHWPERTEGGFETTSQAMQRAGIKPGEMP